MKSMRLLEARIEAETERRVCTNVAVELLKLGQLALEDIATVCHMPPAQVQALADSLHH